MNSFDWKKYIMGNPDLIKNWNGPIKARIHFIIFGKWEKRPLRLTIRSDHWEEDWKRLVRENRSIFVHIPKCAGTSIDVTLLNSTFVQFDEINKLWVQHATAHNLKTVYFTQDEWNSFFTFTIVRNPFDRFVSTYNWLCELKGIEKNDKTFYNFTHGKKEFKELLDPKKAHCKDNYYHHLIPQIEYITENGKIIVDFVGRFENLNADWEHICAHLKEPHTLPHLNKVARPHYTTYFNAKTRAKVEKDYKRDLEVFKYTFGD